MSAVRYGYTIVWVGDVVAAMQFYQRGLGLTPRTIQHFGEVDWGEMETGGTTIAFASEVETEALFGGRVVKNRKGQDPAAILLSFIVEDVETVFQNALHAGATAIDSPKQEPWGQTVARLRDPNGVLVSIANERTR